jgi:hypothetical protein
MDIILGKKIINKSALLFFNAKLELEWKLTAIYIIFLFSGHGPGKKDD